MAFTGGKQCERSGRPTRRSEARRLNRRCWPPEPEVADGWSIRNLGPPLGAGLITLVMYLWARGLHRRNRAGAARGASGGVIHGAGRKPPRHFIGDAGRLQPLPGRPIAARKPRPPFARSSPIVVTTSLTGASLKWSLQHHLGTSTPSGGRPPHRAKPAKAQRAGWREQFWALMCDDDRLVARGETLAGTWPTR